MTQEQIEIANLRGKLAAIGEFLDEMLYSNRIDVRYYERTIKHGAEIQALLTKGN